MGNGALAVEDAQFEQAESFIPERWLKNNEDLKCPRAKDAHPFVYMPFGFGTRMCIGRRYAEMQIEVLICRLLREFRLEWPHPELKFKSTLINMADGPLTFRMTEV